MDKIRIDSLCPIRVARFADADVDRIVFDVSPWRTAYPTLNDYRVEVTAPNGLVYIPVKVELNGDDFIWTITAEDTASVGAGTYQIVGTGENGERKTSASATFVVRSTMSGSADETPPDPAKPWVDEVVKAAERAEAAAERAENAGGSSGNGGGGSGKDGESAYEIAVKHGFEGSEEEWLESLHGRDGEDGEDGEDGNPGVYIGGDKPTDPDIQVWVDPDGKAAKIPPVDNTLTVSGAAADSAVVGQKIANLNEEIVDQNRDYWIKQRRRFSDKPIMVAYSHGADLGMINTELAYINAAIAGFEWLKGDVQPTSDGKLIMCHDDGFTLDANGYITAYNASNSTPIHDFSYAECMAMEYARTYTIDTNGVKYRPKVCDLEQFLVVCREFGARPYIVIRDDYTDIVVPELLRLLDVYDFTENCIVNCYKLEPVRAVAEASGHRVMISTVTGYEPGIAFPKYKIDDLLAASPNCTINIYADRGWSTIDLIDASREAIDYAKSLGVVVGTSSVSEPHELLAKGIGLCQCNSVCINTKAFPVFLCVEILNGVASVKRFNGWGARHTADITFNGTTGIVLKLIRINGTTRDFPDGVTPNLASIYPYTISVTGDIEATPTLTYGCRIGLKLAQSVADIDTTTVKRLFVKFVYGI